MYFGLDIMCPGMTSPGAKLPVENIPKDTVVAIYAEGKEHALAVGLTNMSTVIHSSLFISFIRRKSNLSTRE